MNMEGHFDHGSMGESPDESLLRLSCKGSFDCVGSFASE